METLSLPFSFFCTPKLNSSFKLGARIKAVTDEDELEKRPLRVLNRICTLITKHG